MHSLINIVPIPTVNGLTGIYVLKGIASIVRGLNSGPFEHWSNALTKWDILVFK